MLTKRIIACLDVRDGQVVKGVQFQQLRHAGDPAELARRYNVEGIDEVVVLDITATLESRQALAKTMKDAGFDLVAGGTDTHLMLVDLRPKKLTGNVAAEALERAGITCNKNGVPFDPEKPTVTSGIRLGTPAGTTRGFGTKEFTQVGMMIERVLDARGDAEVERKVRRDVEALCRRFPIYDAM